MYKKTIAAIATPAGSGGIGIVRISGPEALNIAKNIFRPKRGKRLTDLSGYSGTLGEVIEGGEIIDEAIAFVYHAPKSYTGEEVVEISCHGGVWVTRRILRLCLSQGAVMAQPGEFTRRAFLNGKMDLTEAEAVMDVINAEGDAALKTANSAREGALSTKVKELVEIFLREAAHLAAWADYPEEDMEEVDATLLLLSLKNAREDIGRLLDTYDQGKIVRDGIETVITGKPNVGKSTLMNLLSGEERSIVTDIPGTTRDIVRDSVRLGDITLKLSDTAGIRGTDDPVELAGVDRAKALLESSQLILALFDSAEALDTRDKELLELLSGRNCIAIINKIDMPQRLNLDLIKKKIPHVISMSAKTGEGRDELERLVRQMANIKYLDAGEAVVATERQRRHLMDASGCVNEAVGALESGMTLDAVSVCIEGALDALLSLTGEKAGERVINEVFSKFCVGK